MTRARKLTLWLLLALTATSGCAWVEFDPFGSEERYIYTQESGLRFHRDRY